jgi:hypothetical protein
MKKTSLYMRKLQRQKIQDAKAKEHADFESILRHDIQTLRDSAGIHAWVGNDGANECNLAGRICYIVAYAAPRSGVDVDHVDLRIIRGLAESLGDLCANLDRIDHYRASIQSGLLAIDRLLERCQLLHLLDGSLELDAMLASAGIMGTSDIKELFDIAA